MASGVGRRAGRPVVNFGRAGILRACCKAYITDAAHDGAVGARRVNIDREFKLATRIIVFAMIWLVCLWALFRLAIPWLWGEPIALAPVLAFAAAVLGVVALAYLALAMVRNVRAQLARNTEQGSQDHA